MFKHLLGLIVLSFIVVLTLSYCQDILNFIQYLHQQVFYWLGLAFSNNYVGMKLSQMLALIILPLFVGILLALLTWSIYRRLKPAIIVSTVWYIWLISTVVWLMSS